MSELKLNWKVLLLEEKVPKADEVSLGQGDKGRWGQGESEK